MSKMDNLRAMREARYAESQARAKANAATAVTTPAAMSQSVKARPERAPVLAVVPDLPEAAAEEALCGHRNMSGRTCTREAGHSAKSHRYS